MQNLTFYLKWVTTHLIGFMGGHYLGATSAGLIPAVLPGNMGLVIGDLIYGATIGFFQWLVLKNNKGLIVSIWWSALVGVGFMLGARVGALLTYRIVSEWFLAGIVFGCFMGGSIGLATALGFRNTIPFFRLLVWVAISVFAWIAGESIAFASNFSQTTVPWVALAIGGITGVGVIWMRSAISERHVDISASISE